MIQTQAPEDRVSQTDRERRDTYPVSDLRENPERLFGLLRAEHRHLTIAVEGEPEAVLVSPAEYQRLLDLAADANFAEAIRQSTEDEKAGRTRPAEEFFAEFRAKNAIPCSR